MPSGVLLKLNFGLRRAIVGRNSIPLVSKTSQFSSRRSLVRSSMAASSSKAVFGDVHIDDMIATCGNGLEFSKPSAVFFSDRSRSSCLKSSVKMRNRELPNSRLVCGNFMLDAMRGNGKANNLVVGTLLKNLYSSSSVCFSAGAAQDVSFDGNSHKEQVVDSTVVSGQNLKLLSGSCYLPHPDKEETGGEDAHFICEDEQAIGVADGVGGWADVGVNAGEFSRELMSHSVSAIQEEPNGSFDPARVLEKAHAKQKLRVLQRPASLPLIVREYVLLIWEIVDSWWLEMDVLSSDPQCSSMASILHINWKVAMEVIYPALGRFLQFLLLLVMSL
ncbi:hypothetical protein H0E87_010490 [Populus deltoides]|uniref:Protein phosphatase n=1 Tax=Populus deltoides TaxID=3696 RepID=A0A8T2YTK8_POPDE|nr:hypothetical protein H0E87_010490 [Populus deltoides]